jgi:hypothetical protein
MNRFKTTKLLNGYVLFVFELMFCLHFNFKLKTKCDLACYISSF